MFRLTILKISNYINKGLWNKNTTLSFEDNNGEMSQITFDKKNLKSTTSIKTITIDSIYKNLNKKIDYIKMDIEGAEIEAILGAQNCIKECKPKFVIASYHIRDGEKTNKKVNKLLSKYYKNVQTINGKQLLSITK